MNADAIQAVASVINLAIVILFFLVERKSLARSIKQERSEYWYHETLLNRGLEAVEKCFAELENLVIRADSLYPYEAYSNSEAKIREIIMEVSKQISFVKRVLSVYTKLFDDDLSKSAKTMLEGLEDLLTEEIEKDFMAKVHCNNLVYDLSTYKYKILNLLYKYDTGKKR